MLRLTFRLNPGDLIHEKSGWFLIGPFLIFNFLDPLTQPEAAPSAEL